MEQRTKITLAWELHEQGVSNSQIARRLEVNRETVNRWVAAVRERGLLPYLDGFRAAERAPRPSRQVPLTTKQLVWRLREREEGCCGQKIAYFLEKEHGIRLSVPAIYAVLREKYTLRPKGRKKTSRGPVPAAQGPRQVVQMDTIFFGRVFAFTAVDIFSKEADVFSKEADVLLRPSVTALDGAAFLHACMPRRFGGWARLIQTDGGSEFEADFAQAVGGYCERHRVARPYKKNEQSYIESFNRTVRSECLGWLKYGPDEIPALTRQVEAFLERYHHHRPHLGLVPVRPPLAPPPPRG
jgi:transposase